MGRVVIIVVIFRIKLILVILELIVLLRVSFGVLDKVDMMEIMIFGVDVLRVIIVSLIIVFDMFRVLVRLIVLLINLFEF